MTGVWGRSQHLSKADKDTNGSTGAKRRVTRTEAASANGAGPAHFPGRERMGLPQMDRDERVARARQKITEGFYDRDEVRRAIAEALMFVLNARRD